ncbi:ectoine hydroxylase [Thauera linaloolentis]|uniref:Ectoine hydroxylase n=1 Tax=Thauera linaloolentis (strain DSM 12138 / JCM 21573 / CCUG 41526 / CIP 105981 / IAM 15112 / NBRC 102519 / 47Lol) TaxID=1123367 RepID=N6Z3X8_THAL4|nr:ectoine hydroxylase [Thauera linaloolentis]ENO89113.1 ectoine hydroxylase [Thauera linaloolentis 47Lol = DSM 12138]MCM8565740.1 ectoine hydroxylase [Thauera linaloolentis]
MTTTLPPRAAHARPRDDDRYPSRFWPEPRIADRQDPVVHGHAGDGPLSETELRFYRDNGYLTFDQLIGADELGACLGELDALRRDETVRHAAEAIIEPGSGELRSLFEVHRRSAVLRRLCAYPRLVAIARQLLGSEVYLHQSRINYKSGFRGKEFYWHSDFETWHMEDGIPAMRMVSCSVSLTPNTPHNGPLMIIPGSHQRYISCVGATPQAHYLASLRRQEVGVPDDASLMRLVEEFGIVAPTGPAGSVTFFDCNVMHGSNSNITPLPRSNVFFVYNSVHNTPAAPFCGLPPRPSFIAERRDFTPLPPHAAP